jgi:hypothetical protein
VITPEPSVFVSHSHHDKRVARRIVRTLAAHGVRVRIDEQDLRFGVTLTASLRAQIEATTVLLVVASQASAASKWVGLEVEFAREQGKAVVPFLIEPVADHERFRDHLGVDATRLQDCGDAVHDLIRKLFLSVDQEPPPVDRAALASGLRELAREEPDLAPLIFGCLDLEGLHRDNMDSVYKASFHPLDYALNALFDLMPTRVIAEHAAHGFCLAGAGTRALSQWIAETGDGGLPIAIAMDSPLDRSLIPTAIKLLGLCDPRNDQALEGFIYKSATQLDQQQQRSVIRLVTWPLRGPDGADMLGRAAMKYFPGSAEVQHMWCRWVQAGGVRRRALTTRAPG